MLGRIDRITLSIVICAGTALGASAQANTSRSAAAHHSPPLAAQALIDKSDGIVLLFDEQGQEIGRFDAVFGKNREQGHKNREGDRRTPEGDYTLSPARPSKSWGWFMPISYPNARDVAWAKNHGIPVSQIGGAVGLHGTGGRLWYDFVQWWGSDWTAGCVAVSDEDINKIRQVVQRAIPLRIEP